MAKPKKMKTPGSYNLAKKKKGGKVKKAKSTVGRPSLPMKRKPRVYKKAQYTRDDMEMAVEMVRQQGIPVARAARACNIPRVTLIDRLSGKHKSGGAGRRRELTDDEEKVLVELLVLMGQFNYPLTKRHLRDRYTSYKIPYCSSLLFHLLY
jgi:transposase-like protein